ncbi:MAG TPA: Hsp20/alpha crystallin family protein [Micropepsaceae bacterium]|nr:Hsp20/alpha crystallin family protein [Micropepsaceae bacterium]
MTEPLTKLPVKKVGQNRQAVRSPLRAWHPFEQLHQQIDRLFNDYDGDVWSNWPRGSVFEQPTWRDDLAANVPAVDVVEKEQSYEISAELPGLAQKDVEVSLANSTLTIKGEKKEEKEEKARGYYVSERHYGSFTRSFRVPEGIDADKIEAHFRNGVLTIALPKTAEAQAQEKKITIKAA